MPVIKTPYPCIEEPDKQGAASSHISPPVCSHQDEGCEQHAEHLHSNARTKICCLHWPHIISISDWPKCLAAAKLPQVCRFTAQFKLAPWAI
eukprot:775830-Amphidinium_carterae.2